MWSTQKFIKSASNRDSVLNQFPAAFADHLILSKMKCSNCFLIPFTLFPEYQALYRLYVGFFQSFFRIKFYTLKRGQVVFSLLTFAFCEVILVCAFIVTVAKMLWIIIIMLIWKLVHWVQEAVKQLQLTSNNFWI